MGEWKRNMDRNQQIRECRKGSLSIAEIANLLNINKSTVSFHCRGIKINRERINIKIKENGKKASDRAKTLWDINKKIVREEASKEWEIIKINPELMGFLGLYWGEGSKLNGGKDTSAICITNSDPQIIKFCAKMFRKLDPNAKLVARVTCYQDQDLKQCETIWKNATLVPIKITIKESKRWSKSTHGGRSKYGTCYLKFNNWKIFNKIIKWIDLWSKEISVS
jgi:hypothetical protein